MMVFSAQFYLSLKYTNFGEMSCQTTGNVLVGPQCWPHIWRNRNTHISHSGRSLILGLWQEWCGQGKLVLFLGSWSQMDPKVWRQLEDLRAEAWPAQVYGDQWSYRDCQLGKGTKDCLDPWVLRTVLAAATTGDFCCACSALCHGLRSISVVQEDHSQAGLGKNARLY
jgi:hypothetical protein